VSKQNKVVADLEGKPSLGTLISSHGATRMMFSLLLLNILVQFTRPQDWIPGLGPILELIRFPFLLSLLAFFIWLPRAQFTLNRVTKAMIALLVIQAVFILIGSKYIFDGFIVNDGWARAKWRDLAQQFFGYYFPIIALCFTGIALRRLLRTLLVCGLFLSIYALSHSGRGPGGFVGDENDLALTLLLLLPFALCFLLQNTRLVSRVWLLICSISGLAGIVMTSSRGGFVGLVVALGYLLLKSKHRIVLSFLMLLMFCGVVLLAPSEYLDEVKSIADVSSGTAKSRTELWKIASRMWLDPPNILTGVGMGNFRWRVGDYESSEEIMSLGRSRASRQVHSMYFEILTELGILGFAFFLYFLYYSFFGNNRAAKNVYFAGRSLVSMQQSLVKKRNLINAVPIDEQLQQLQALQRELALISTTLQAINVSWIGVLAAGAFISIFYYPPIWVLIMLSCIVQRYARSVLDAASQIE